MAWAARLFCCTLILPAAARQPSTLLVLPGATNVERRSQYGAEGVQYELDAPFPALQPIQKILDHMSALGWQPLKEDWLNPGIPTSYVRSWVSFEDHSSKPWVHRYAWSSSWRNPTGDLVSYDFRYVLPDAGKRPLSRLTVSASLVPVRLAEQMKAQTEQIAGRSRREGLPSDEHLPGGAGPMLRLDARPPDALLLSNHQGGAIVQLLETNGAQVSYRWRYRNARTGVQSTGRAPPASTIQAGPFRLSWHPESTLSSAVGLHEREVDVIPLPGEFFESLDLAQVRRLASLTPDRDDYYRAHQPSPADRSRSRKGVFFESARTLPIQKGQILFVTGPAGRGVAEFDEVDKDRMTYRWRFKDKSGLESSGTTRYSPPSPGESFRLGKYELVWMTRSTRTVRSAEGTGSDWSGEVRFLPEEVSCLALPGAVLSRVDLDHDPAPQR